MNLLIIFLMSVLMSEELFAAQIESATASQGADVVKLEKSCVSGSAVDCSALGFNYLFGQGVKQDHFKSVGLYEKACDGGDAAGCANLGAMYATGQGVKQDYFKAVGLYQKACDGGNAIGCTNLGAM